MRKTRKKAEGTACLPAKAGMLLIFKKGGEKNSRNKDYQFWQQDNRPIQLTTPSFTLEKLNYIHNNPVKAGIVEKPEDYLLGSARAYYGMNGCCQLNI